MSNVSENSKRRISIAPLLITLFALAVMIFCMYQGWTLAALVFQIILISIVIWQACDPFAEAAQWIGTKLHIPGSVRGATLDAVASSMPELFSGLFFVIVAFWAVYRGDPNATAATMAQAGGEGYGSTIATCAGSAVYNMMLIPAVCAIAISFTRRSRPTIDVDQEVISRDGVWFLLCEAVLLIFLFQPEMHWWMALVFLGLYVIYITQLYFDAKRFRRNRKKVHQYLTEATEPQTPDEVIAALKKQGVRSTPKLIEEVKKELAGIYDEDDEESEEISDSAEYLFGWFEVKLSHATAWTIIAVSTAITAFACYWLVEATIGIAQALHVPTFFVAVILAAAASSVPDTFLSIGASRRGDDSGAVSNAFGSNIFDICICLSIPLLVSCWLAGWQPILLTQDGVPIPGLFWLRILLFVLSGITLLIMWHNRQLTRLKAIVLILLYMIFVAYAVIGSISYESLPIVSAG